MNKKVEFITFVVLSLIGMLLNSFLIWIVVGPIYGGNVALQQNIGHNLIYTIAKSIRDGDCYGIQFCDQKNISGEKVNFEKSLKKAAQKNAAFF